MLKKVEIYTDGACSGNPGIGGYCGILFYKGKELVVSGAEQETTNNRMELTAVIKALEKLKEKCEVDLYSDSAYVINAINNDWITNWKNCGWKTADKKPVANQDLWEKLLILLEGQCVTFIKVKGHSDNENNNRCDKIAREEIKKLC